LLVTGWDPAVLDSRLATMRTILHQLTGNPSMTASAVIERFRDSPVEARTRRRQWELLNQARAGLRDWVTTRSGIYALGDSTIQRADDRIGPRLRAAAALERVVDDHVERQLRVAGYALAVFRHLSGRTDGDAAEETAIRWAGIAFHLGGSDANGLSHLIPGPDVAPRGAAIPDQEAGRTLGASVRPVILSAGSPGRTGPADRIATEFPSAALTRRSPSVVRLDPARRGPRPGAMPRRHP
jgi:hypothetical protein